jgi:hypothetical protein
MVVSREQNDSSVQLIKELEQQVHSSNASIRRKAAYNLAWLQEDGMEVLKGILFGNNPIMTKNAASYGLRKTQGRMKKIAIDVLMQGLKCNNSSTIQVCRNALLLLGLEIPKDYQLKKQTPRNGIIKNRFKIIGTPSPIKLSRRTINTKP